MNFGQAFELMKQGVKVKLPNWAGYWAWENGTIMMHCKDGEVIDLRDTDRPEYTFANMASDEFMVTDEKNTPILGGSATFSFGEAIKFVKRGMKVRRKGWNGKTQYIELASCISYKNPKEEVINAEHDNIGNQAIAFVGTSGVQLGWLASQADMLAEDWEVIE